MLLFVIVIVLSPFIIHFWLIKKTKEWKDGGKYFAAVPEKEVVCTSKSGGPVSLYIGSLKGEGLQIDRLTGQICNGEAKKSWWNKHYGVEFIGFGGQIVNVPRAIVDENGKTITTMSPSTRFVDDITVIIKEAETKDGIFPIDMKLEVTVRIYNMSTMLRYKEGYQKKVDTLIKAAVNEFARDKEPKYMLGLKNEKPDNGARSDFMELIMSLNFGTFGNESLTKLVGIDIIAVSIAEADPSGTELRNLMEAKRTAEIKGEEAVAKAEGEAKKAKVVAEGEAVAAKVRAEGEAVALEIVNAAKASGLKRKLDVLGDAQVLASIESAELIGKAIENFDGTTLAINTGVALGVPGSTPEKKEKKS